MQNIKRTPITEDKDKKGIHYNVFPLTKTNFILMGISGALIIIGFLLMLGSANDTTTFNNEIFSDRRIVVGPTMAFIGFVSMAVAIIYQKKKKD